jgi:hypothetical protein
MRLGSQLNDARVSMTLSQNTKDYDFMQLQKLLDETGFSIKCLFDFTKEMKMKKQVLSQEIGSKFGTSIIVSSDNTSVSDIKGLVIQPELDAQMTTDTPIQPILDQKDQTFLDRSLEEWEQMTDEQILHHFSADN